MAASHFHGFFTKAELQKQGVRLLVESKKSPVLDRFNEIEGAIKSHDDAALRAHLSSPRAVLVDAKTNRNILHVVCQFGNPILLKLIFEILKRDQLIEMLQSDAEVLIYKKRMMNPIQVLLAPNQVADADVEVMQRTLESLPLHCVEKGMHELIDEEDVQQRYGHLDTESEVYQDLELACKLINGVRAYQFLSSNHPKTEMKSSVQFQHLNDVRQAIMDTWQKTINENEEHDAEITYNTYVSKQNSGDPDQAILGDDEKFVANCGELTDIAKHLLKQKNENAYKRSQVVCIDQGNHAFLMIGDVFCDVWLGEYGLRSEMSEHITNCYDYWSSVSDKHIVVTSRYNPAIHKVVPFYSSGSFLSEKAEQTIAEPTITKGIGG